jgi:lysozyme
MKISDAGLEAVKTREGVVLTMYRDSAGLPTIGVGHLLTKDELKSGKIAGLGEWRHGLTEGQADELLRRDLAIAEAAVDAVIVPLEPHQRDALISFAFNVGAGAFQGSTLFGWLNHGDYTSVPGQLRRWIHSAGRRDPVLISRRESEVRQWNGVA